jgi:demethylmenaquinone methyltransferase/2-methoxy-6-polyprenyl-1,4-benzoquinol methylase
MFASIAGRYDTANTVMSFGAHHRWRRALVKWSGVRPGERVLDCATGTGDLAFLFSAAVGSGGEVVGSDFCEPMLDVARVKAAQRNLNAIRFETADVTRLPYPDDRFDVSSIAFGIRNTSDPRRALAELGRVTRSGGRVLVLEFGERQIPVWRQCFGMFSRHVLPRLGGWVTGQRAAYEYLQKSSSTFPCGEGFLEWMRQAGVFRKVEYRTLLGGVVYLYRAEVQ